MTIDQTSKTKIWRRCITPQKNSVYFRCRLVEIERPAKAFGVLGLSLAWRCCGFRWTLGWSTRVFWQAEVFSAL